MRVLILGAGLSGMGAAHLMVQQGHDVTVCNGNVFDAKELIEMGVHCIFSDAADVNDGSYDIFIKAPGIPDSHPLVQTFSVVTNEIEWAYRYSTNYRYYAISGTNGKTTSTMMLYDMLKAHDDKAILAGNVGIALSEMVYQKGNEKLDVALEISAFQIDGLEEFRAKAYGLLNLSPDHLDHYGAVEDYYASKMKLASMSDVFICNFDDTQIKAQLETYQGEYLGLSLEGDADIMLKDDKITFKGELLFYRDDLKLVGRHNLYNATLASALAHLAGVNSDTIREVLSQFKAVEHRCEYVDTINDITYYNDSKATNPESVVVCLNSFEQEVILLAGGSDKKISFEILKSTVDKVKHAYLFGESAQQLAEIYPQHTIVNNMDEGFDLAHKIAQGGDVILLSPACASYDQFKNFEVRGTHFKSLVSKMKV